MLISPSLLLELDPSDGLHWWGPSLARMGYLPSQHCRPRFSLRRGSVAPLFSQDWVSPCSSSLWLSLTLGYKLKGREFVHLSIPSTIPSAQWMVGSGRCWLLFVECCVEASAICRREERLGHAGSWTWEVWRLYSLAIVNAAVLWGNTGWRGSCGPDATAINIKPSFRPLTEWIKARWWLETMVMEVETGWWLGELRPRRKGIFNTRAQAAGSGTGHQHDDNNSEQCGRMCWEGADSTWGGCKGIGITRGKPILN